MWGHTYTHTHRSQCEVTRDGSSEVFKTRASMNQDSVVADRRNPSTVTTRPTSRDSVRGLITGGSLQVANVERAGM